MECKIRLKRSIDDFNTITNSSAYSIDYGEPIITYSGENAAYMLIGNKSTSVNTNAVSGAIKLHDKNIVDNGVFYKIATKYNTSFKVITDDSGNDLSPIYINSSWIRNNSGNTLDTIIGEKIDSKISDISSSLTTSVNPTSNTTSTNIPVVGWNTSTGKYNYNSSVYLNCSTGVLFGAAWNDYAEYRKTVDSIIPGTCVVDFNDGLVVKSDVDCASNAYIVTDTFGMIIGDKKNSTPVAICGRVLAYFDDKYGKPEIGEPVMSTSNGRIAIMSRELVKEYPERIIGTISEIPTYDKWNGIDINGRIWIKIK